MEQDEVYRTAATHLRDVRTAIKKYNNFAMENGLYVFGLLATSDGQSTDEVLIAESFIPKEILDYVYKIHLEV